MAIPDFQSVMLPLLKFCADGQEHTNRQAIDTLSQEFGLSEEEQKQLLPSGRQCIFDNRIAWARAHMKIANLIENTRRGVFRITERGKNRFSINPRPKSTSGFCGSSLNTLQRVTVTRITGKAMEQFQHPTIRKARRPLRSWKKLT